MGFEEDAVGVAEEARDISHGGGELDESNAGEAGLTGKLPSLSIRNSS